MCVCACACVRCRLFLLSFFLFISFKFHKLCIFSSMQILMQSKLSSNPVEKKKEKKEIRKLSSITLH